MRAVSAGFTKLRTTSAPAVMVPRKQAGHMTCTRPQAERQILLETRASSTHDPNPRSLLPVLMGQHSQIADIKRRPAANGDRELVIGGGLPVLIPAILLVAALPRR